MTRVGQKRTDAALTAAVFYELGLLTAPLYQFHDQQTSIKTIAPAIATTWQTSCRLADFTDVKMI